MADLDGPWQLETDAAGNVFITGRFSDNVLRLAPDGALSEVIGPLGDGLGNTLETARDVAVAANGNMYVTSSSGDYNVFQVSTDGTISKVIDRTGDGSSAFDLVEPQGVAVDRAGNVYVTSSGTDKVFRIAPNRVITEIMDSSGDGQGNRLVTPFGVATDELENVYVVGAGSANVFKIDTKGAISVVLDSSGDGQGNELSIPRFVATDGRGNVYVTGRGSDNVFKIASDGAITEVIDENGDGRGNRLDGPWGITTDARGNAFVTGRNSNNAFRVSPTGEITEIISREGDGAGNELIEARGIAVNDDGDVFIAGHVSENVFKYELEAQQNLEALADTYIRTDLAVRRNDNYGCQQFLAVGTSRGGNSDSRGDADAMRGLVQFDLTELASSVVTGAWLEMTVAGYDEGSASDVFAVDVHRVVDSPGNASVGQPARTPWLEGRGFETNGTVPAGCVGTDPADGVAWSGSDTGNSDASADNNVSQPDFEPVAVASVTIPRSSTASGDVVRWDVTDAVDDWLDGTHPNFGLMLRDVTTDGEFRGIRMGARESDLLEIDDEVPSVDGPRLVVELSTEPVCEQTEIAFAPRLLNLEGSDVSNPVPVRLGCETYLVLLHSLDGFHAPGHQPRQTREIWVLEGLDDSGAVIYTSPPTPDLPEDKTWASFSVGAVDLTGVATLRARHVRDDLSINSIEAGVILIPADSVTVSQGTIIIKKVVADASSPQDFTFVDDIRAPNTFDLDDDNDGTLSNTMTFTDVDPGVHSVTETVPDGWDLTSATCDDGSDPIAIDLSAGETVTCTFTNTQHGSIHGFKFEDLNGDAIYEAEGVTEIIDATGDGAGNTVGNPQRVTTDVSGNVYVSAIATDNVFKITPAGIVTEIIDDLTAGGLSDPNGMATDADGNLYVTGYASDNVFKITPAGVITQIIDSSGDGAGNTLNGPLSIATDSDGNAHVTGGLSDNVFKITPAGVITQIIDSSGDGAGNTLQTPWGIAVDGDDNVHVSGANSSNAFKITPAGLITKTIDASGDGAGNTLEFAGDVAVDTAGNAYVIGTNSNNAFKITTVGAITEIIDVTGDGVGNGFGSPQYVATDAEGNVYVSAASSNNAFKITPEGVITEIIDATGDGAGNTLGLTREVATDRFGNVFVVGQTSVNVFRVAPDEPAIADVTFTLTGGGLITPVVTTTNAAGRFSFDDLAPGTYTVTETIPAGYTSTTGSSAVITIGPGEEVVAYAGQATLDPGQFETINTDLLFGNTVTG